MPASIIELKDKNGEVNFKEKLKTEQFLDFHFYFLI
jgi:hypothetical protein